MNLLKEIAAQARKRVEEGYYDIELPKKKRRSLARLLEKKKVIIAEIKPVSPSKGRLVEGSPVEVGRRMVEAGADALSVLTEPSFFGGDLLTLAVDFGVPVLQKDFVFDERQMSEAADCVLVISAFAKLVRASVNELVEAAHAKGLEVLLETHSLEEFREAKKTGADVIGINNRCLETLEVDLKTTLEILAREKPDRPVVSESGIQTRADAEAVAGAGASGILVGTSLLKAGDLKKKMRELRDGLEKGGC